MPNVSHAGPYLSGVSSYQRLIPVRDPVGKVFMKTISGANI